MADHPLYVEVAGTDHMEIEVFVGESVLEMNRGAKQRLCTLVGGEYTYYQHHSGVPTLRLEALNGATDFEHDPSRSADLTVALPYTTYDSSNIRSIVGILTDAVFYPPGVDPLVQSDNDTGASECTECEEPHRFAPYMPPERDETIALLGKPVLVEMRYIPREKPEGEETS